MNPRSYLFVPADRPQRYAKALNCGADAVIIDLEDAVAPADKDAAREALAQWLGTSDAGMGILVRVNGVDSPWFDADRVLVSQSPRVAAVMLPKADGNSPWSAFGGRNRGSAGADFLHHPFVVHDRFEATHCAWNATVGPSCSSDDQHLLMSMSVLFCKGTTFRCARSPRPACREAAPH